MTPGLILICDPRTQRAMVDVETVLDLAGASCPDDYTAAAGRGWALALIRPPRRTETCRAEVFTDGCDVLAWTGDVFLPDRWRSRDQSTAAILLERLQRDGTEVLGKLDGAFCGAWYDGSRHAWTVFTDKFGQLPVFWFAGEERFIAAPRAAWTQAISDEPLDFCNMGAIDLIRTENMIDDHTLIEGVHWLRGGHSVQWSDEGCGTYSFWELPTRAATVHEPDEAIARYVDTLEKTIRRYTDEAAPLMLGLSGGIDSRLYLAACQRIGCVPDTFTVGHRFADDVRFGRALAKATNTPNEWVPLDAQNLDDRMVDAILATDGLHSVAHLPTAAMMRRYLSDHKSAVLLEGYLHGAPAGQYIPADREVSWDDPPHTSAWAKRALHAGGDIATINAMLRPELADDSFRRWKFHVNNRCLRAPFNDTLRQAEHAIVGGRSGRIDVLGTHLLRRDVIVRTPACDQAMIDWYTDVSPELRRGKALCLETIRRHFPSFSRVPRTASSALPIAEDPWLRELCWQKERLHKIWLRLRHPRFARWGTGGTALRAWTFETWRKTGRLDLLSEPDARVLNWVAREPLRILWNRAVENPLDAGPLLALATLEIMTRELEAISRTPRPDHMPRIQFRKMCIAQSPAADNIPAGVSLNRETRAESHLESHRYSSTDARNLR